MRKTLLDGDIRSRDLLRDAAADLARLVIDTAGLDSAMYKKAGEVLQLATAKSGNRSALTIEEMNELFDLMAGQINQGKSQVAAAQYAQQHAACFLRLTERQLINIFKSVAKLQFNPSK
ncbi:MAG: hypothetical protein HYU78_00495 [Rhodocyclales bacterium]|nr:hypothetical protein [Rhodocyclales bacterium]